MSESERKELLKKITAGIVEAQERLFERKAKLGEQIVVSDKNGNPIEISPEKLKKQ